MLNKHFLALSPPPEGKLLCIFAVSPGKIEMLRVIIIFFKQHYMIISLFCIIGIAGWHVRFLNINTKVAKNQFHLIKIKDELN